MSGSKRIAKFAASTNAQERYLFPFFVLPIPLRLPLESFSLDRVPALAAELIGLDVNIIVTSGMPAVIAAKKATSTIPIVTAGADNLVEAGVIASLAHHFARRKKRINSNPSTSDKTNPANSQAKSRRSQYGGADNSRENIARCSPTKVGRDRVY